MIVNLIFVINMQNVFYFLSLFADKLSAKFQNANLHVS